MDKLFYNICINVDYDEDKKVLFSKTISLNSKVNYKLSIAICLDPNII